MIEEKPQQRITNWTVQSMRQNCFNVTDNLDMVIRGILKGYVLVRRCRHTDTGAAAKGLAHFSSQVQ